MSPVIKSPVDSLNAIIIPEESSLGGVAKTVAGQPPLTYENKASSGKNPNLLVKVLIAIHLSVS